MAAWSRSPGDRYRARPSGVSARPPRSPGAGLVLAEKKEPLGYVSDHIGLRARMSLTAMT
jgi:hypothetical protein